MESISNKPEGQNNDTTKDSYFSWSYEMINEQNDASITLWGAEYLINWHYDVEQLQNWLYQNSKILEDIHNHLLHYGDGEEALWQDDVWGLLQYTQIPEFHAKDEGRAKGT